MALLPSFDELMKAMCPTELISTFAVPCADLPEKPSIYMFTTTPAPIRLMRETDINPGSFGILLRKDKSKPAQSSRSIVLGGKIEIDFECDRCGATRTPEMRVGPNGRRTLCNRCGLKWARETKRQKT